MAELQTSQAIPVNVPGWLKKMLGLLIKFNKGGR
jgi:hypothetical protein